jgi:hypothetical protein
VYVMGCVDKTLFTLNHDIDFLLVQIYVDDIIFVGSSHTLVSRFQEIMESEFQMSMMEELTFFLGIQVKQTKQGNFVHQADLMKKFKMTELKHVSTPMSTATSLGPDEDGDAVDQREYRSMIGSLLYLTVTRRTFSLPWGCVHTFRLSHILHIRWQFSEFSGILNTLLSLRFGILLLLRLILSTFLMLILPIVGLTERALLVLVIFLDLLSFVDLLENSFLLHSSPPRPSM